MASLAEKRIDDVEDQIVQSEGQTEVQSESTDLLAPGSRRTLRHTEQRAPEPRAEGPQVLQPDGRGEDRRLVLREL